MIRRALVALLLAGLFALGALLPGCGMDDPQGELIYRVTARDGTAADKEDIRRAVNRMDTRLTRAGYKRKDVHALGPGRIRVVLPENVVPKLAEIRRLLEKDAELTVKLTLTK